MRIGFITACFPQLDLGEVCAFAASTGYEALEIAAWPPAADRPFTASHLDVRDLGPDRVEDTRRLLDDHGIQACSLSYYDNNLHPDPDERAAVNAHVDACIEAAAALDVPTVGTFVGRDPSKSVADNLREADEVFKPLVAKAGELGVKIVIENCVMEGWHPDGYPGNLAYSPELWEWMFEQGLYLNYDPSHLIWMGIDPVEAIRPYFDHIPLAQAKDIEVFPERRDRWGWPGKALEGEDPWDVGWWRYRVPGRGEVDWQQLIDVMYEHGYDGVLSVEHEDPVWGGTQENVEIGLQIAYRTLRPLLVA